jgi:branched-chain amino acid transport system ATP-binding protein
VSRRAAITDERPWALWAGGVGITFGGLRALHDVTIGVSPGEIVGLIGPNGAGKTTLLDCLSGYLPGVGRAWLGDVEITGMAPHLRARAGLARSFQDAKLFDTLTVQQTLELAGSRLGDAAATRARIGEMIELVGLGAYRDKFIRELSTGTRRMADIAGILLQRPLVVLLDEPSSGIAQRETEALGPVLRQVRDVTGCAMLIIEHDMPLLLGLADRVYALEVGQVIAEDTPERIVEHPEVVRSYLGDDLVAINRSGALAAAEG